MQGALLENADLRSADLFSAKLYDARVAGWQIKAASLRSVGLSLVLGVTQASVNTAFGDAGTILPIGLERPCHWSSDKPQRPMPLEDDLEYWQWFLRGGPPECADDASD